MDWLNDPKNRPIVAGGLAALIVVMGVVMYFLYFKKPGGSTPPPADAQATTTGDPTGMSVPGDPMATAGGQPQDAAAEAQPAETQTVATSPMEAWRTDPFLPLGYKPPKPGDPKLVPPIRDLPMPRVTNWRDARNDAGPQRDLPQPARRMAGILVNDRVYAILETNGKSEIVQPGDTLEDRLAVVERIERDRVVLKTKDEKPRYLVVRMAASVRTDINPASSPTSPMPGGPVMPGTRPGGPMPMPGPGMPAPM